MHYIILFKNLTHIHKLLPIVYSDLLLITLYLILSILALFPYQVLLISLLRVIGGINSYGIILNLTQLFRISIRVKKSPGDIVIKDIKSMPPLRPRLLKSLKACNRKLSKNRKTYLNITATLRVYALVTRTKGIRPYIVGLITCLKDLLIRFLILRGYIGKVIQAGLVLVMGQQRLRFYIQQQGQDTLRNRLRRAVSGRIKRYNKNIIKEK